MKRITIIASLFGVLLTTAAIFGIVGTAAAAPPQALNCFSESPATCVVTGNSNARLNNATGGYALVYLAGKNFQTCLLYTSDAADE